jgi:hypothetical protein
MPGDSDILILLLLLLLILPPLSPLRFTASGREKPGEQEQEQEQDYEGEDRREVLPFLCHD